MNRIAGALFLAVLAASCDIANESAAPGDSSTPATPAAPVASVAPVVSKSSESIELLSGPVASLIGSQIAEIAPDAQAICMGSLDTVTPPSAENPDVNAMNGWAWNTSTNAPFSAFVVVQDSSSKIVGGGKTDHSRPDVPPARPQVTTPEVGWRAYVPVGTGPFTVFAFDSATKTKCWIGAGKN